jgi:hypothetical protein
MKHRQKKLSLSAAIIAMSFASSAWAGNGGPASADRPLNGTCTAYADGTCTPQGVPQGGKADPQGRPLAGTCSQDGPQGACLQEPNRNNSQNSQGNYQQGPHCPTDGTCLLDQPLAELSEAETTTLSFMREEEKLARDVYITLYEEWQRPIFANISKAEQQHMDQIKSLLDRYELPDPASEEVGVFTNTDLQDLYDRLVERGRTSQIEALQVGALIEEVDISDLQNAIAETDNPVLQKMYSNLMNGSYNHLRAFVRNIEFLDYAYQAQSLSQDEVDNILNAVVSRGLGIKVGDSQFVATNAQFKHSLKNKNGHHANGAIFAQSDEVTLGATFQPDIAHLGQNADLLTVATFTPMNSNRQMMFMADNKGVWQKWDGDFNKLTATQTQQRLHAELRLNVYQGPLPAGRYQISVGYRLQDKMIIYGQPMSFSVE